MCDGWVLGYCATLSCTHKILICRQLTFAFRRSLIPCSFHARYYFWPKQFVTNVASKLNGRSRTVILSDDWTIFERFWILAIAFGQERERKCSIYLFIYLKKEEYTVYVYFLEEEIFHQKLCGLVISQTFTSWNTAVPYSLNTFDLPQTLQFKSLVTWKRD